MRRRDFVQRLPVVTAGLASASTVLLSGCSGAPYLVPTTSPPGLVVAVAELGPEGDAFISTPEMQRPIYLRRSPEGWSAVLASCTHRGCQPEPVGDRLACPCHGSEFTFEGDVLTGPADRPLTRYEVSEREGEILIRITGGDS